MYFVTLWTTASAPSSSGRCSAGVANVLSTTTRAPASCAAWATARHVDDPEHRVRRRLEPDDAGLFAEGAAQVLEVGEVDDRVRQPPGLEHRGQEPVRAAVDVVRQHDVVAGTQREQQRGLGRHPAAERERALAALQGGERGLERLARGVAPTRVVEHLGLADRRLRVRGRLVDRDVHRTVELRRAPGRRGSPRSRTSSDLLSADSPGAPSILVSSARRWRPARHGRDATAWTCAWRRDRARTRRA